MSFSAQILLRIFILFYLSSNSLCGNFDPLPTELRNVISSNHIGEGSPIFHEYHALLPTYRGDYGVKSKIVDANSQNPVYKGSDTVIIPLYIPDGAIPLRIHERIARSGKSSANFRILGGPSPSVPGQSSRVTVNRPILRRFGTPSRRNNGPVRKIPTPPPSFIRPWMKRRHGISVTEASDNVEEIQRSKILSHVLDFHKNIEKSKIKVLNGTDSTTKSPKDTKENSTLNNVAKVESTTVSTISATTPSSTTSSDNSTEVAAKNTPKTSSVRPSFPTIAPVRKIKKKIISSSAVREDINAEEKPKPRRTNSRSPVEIKRRRLRPKPADIGFKRSEKILSTTEKSTTTSTTSVASSSTLSSLNSTRNDGKQRLPIWPRRRQPSVSKVPQRADKHPDTESIIDRVLSSTGRIKHSEIKEQFHKSKVNIGNVPKIAPVNLPKNKKILDRKEHIQKKNFSFTTTKPVEVQSSLEVHSRIKGFPIFSSSTPKPVSKSSNAKDSSESSVTNHITTSTPKQTEAPIFIPYSKRKHKPYGEVVRTFKVPSINSSRKFPQSNKSTVLKFKTAQDIVLEKLSSLMTVSAEAGTHSLTEIARDIEKINKELSILGIHIIDAEFDGHKLNLKQPTIKRTPTQKTRRIHGFIPHRRKIIKPTNHTSSTFKNFTISSPKTKKNNFIPHQQANVNSTVYNWRPYLQLEKDVTEKLKPTLVRSTTEYTRTRSTEVVVIPTTEKPVRKHVSNSSQNHQINPESVRIITDFKPLLKAYFPPNINRSVHTDSSTKKSIRKHNSEIPIMRTAGDEATLPEFVIEDLLELNRTSNVPNESVSRRAEETTEFLYLFTLLALLPILAAIFIYYKRKYKPRQKSLPEREEKSEGHSPPIAHVRSSMHAGTLDALPAYVFDPPENRTSPWELPRSKLRITSIIGEGNFGVVWKAEARNLCEWENGGGPTVLVAVKGVKDNSGQKEKADLLRELSIMQHLGQHPNIVTLLGCCTNHEPYYLVMEYVMFGKLLTFLRESRSKNNYFNFSSDSEHLTSKDLTRFAHQISNGCEYLQGKGIIHRDLAARNVLVDHNKTCKICDFGLARSTKDLDSDIYEQKSKGPLPIRWMAPESLFMNIFTHKSDVWSFGILCWEIVTLGSTPYPGISAREVMRRVREGYRLERPEHCRAELYRILSSCWNQDMNKRPSFTVLKTELKDLLDHQTGWVDLENFEESIYYSMHQNNDERL